MKLSIGVSFSIGKSFGAQESPRYTAAVDYQLACRIVFLLNAAKRREDNKRKRCRSRLKRRSTGYRIFEFYWNEYIGTLKTEFERDYICFTISKTEK